MSQQAALTPGTLDVSELSLAELESLVTAHGEAAFRARQIYRWLYRRGISSFEQMTDLPHGVRQRFARTFPVTTPAVAERLTSADGTTKFRLALSDGRQIESVFIPDATRRTRAGAQTERLTLCLSTQVGCAMQCAFCLTGKMGLVRNLTAGEIVGQVRLVAAEMGILERRFNIVLMGMGEPLHNYDATMKALRILAEPGGLAMSPRRMTLSTVGIVPALHRLAGERLMPNVAISLHATTAPLRERLVPVNRKYGLQEVLDACRQFPLKQRARITFEYVLLHGVNDSPDEARRLAQLMRGIRCKVNLIPLNAAPGIPFERPSDEDVNAFAQILTDQHLTVSVRKSRGRDVRAACGQLIVEGPRHSPGQALAQRL